ncbi:MAG: hypothetical protein IT176_02805 [Acidobacteria bacterium]|nr:hypothetical protein [Acidobacteriota bacterium]
MSARVRGLALAAAIAAAAGCGDVVRSSRGPAILNVDLLQGIAGGAQGTPTAVLLSDVLVLRTTPAPCSAATPCPTIVDDFGQATLSLSMKNSTVAPTSNNQVTVSRYTVRYRRSDGRRNESGKEPVLPYDFDGAVTATVPAGGTVAVAFEIVRHTAKEESPLVQLVSNPNVIATVADVTFYGQDLTGNAVSATGSMSVNFGNFADQR